MGKIVVCPKCGFKFSTSYARLVACGECRYAILGGCNLIKCPKCGHEFPYSK